MILVLLVMIAFLIGATSDFCGVTPFVPRASTILVPRSFASVGIEGFDPTRLRHSGHSFMKSIRNLAATLLPTVSPDMRFSIAKGPRVVDPLQILLDHPRDFVHCKIARWRRARATGCGNGGADGNVDFRNRLYLPAATQRCAGHWLLRSY